MQFGGVPERLLLFHRPVLLGFCLRVLGAVVVGFTGSWDYAVLARWLHVFLEYLEIDNIAFLSAPGRAAVEGECPWRSMYAVSGLACGWTADVQNYATRGCHHSSS